MSFTPQALNYFPSQEDAENSTNVMFQDTSFTITEQGGYAAWIVNTTNSISLDYNTGIAYKVSAEMSQDAYTEGDISAQYFLYPASIVYSYNEEITLGIIDEVQLEYSTSYTITTVSGYSNWIISENSTGSSPERILYTAGEILTAGGTYFLFPEPVIWYYANRLDAESRSNSIDNSLPGFGQTSYTIGSTLFSNWTIASNSTGTSSQSNIYVIGNILEGTGYIFDPAIPAPSYYLYPTVSFTPQALNYFPSQEDAQNSTNVIFQDTSFAITEQGGYAAWIVDTTNSVSLDYNTGIAYKVSAEMSQDAYTEGDISAQYFLYPASIVYSYNEEITLGIIDEVQLEYSTSYTITTVSGYSNWIISENSTGSSPERILYTAGEILTAGGTYFLFPEPVIWYYANRLDAESRSNSIDNSLPGFGQTSYTIGSTLFSNWTIASNSTGTSSQSNIYVIGNILEGTGYIFDPAIPAPSYYLYPTVSFTAQALNYFPSQEDAQNSTNVISQSSNFTISSINQYVFWKIHSNTISFDYDSIPHRVGETLSSDGLMVGDGLAQYYLYPFTFIPERLNYFLTRADAINLTNPIYQDDAFTITTRLGYEAWDIEPIHTISLSNTNTVFNGQTLTSDGIVSGDGDAEYYLFVGPRVFYFLNESDALSRVNYYFYSELYEVNDSVGSGRPTELSNWRIASNSIRSPQNFSYVAKQILPEEGTYYMYITLNTYIPPAVSYFPTRLDAQNRTNVIYESNAQSENDMAYIIQSFDGYATWAIDSTHSIHGTYSSNLVLAYNTGKSLLNVYSHSDNPFFYLYPVSIVYYANKSNALAENNLPDIYQLAISTSYTLSNVAGFSNWVVASNSTGTSSQTVMYRAGQTLNTGGTYFLCSPPIYYYKNQSDALSSSNSILVSNSLSIGFNPVNIVIAPNGWKISSNSSGTSSITGIYRGGDILDEGGIYYLYPNLPYAIGGSNSAIVSTIDGIVTVVTLESLTVGSNLRNFLETYNT